MAFVGLIRQKAVARVGETIKARQAKAEASRPQLCLNCGADARKFCPECGQENTPHAIHMGELLRDVWDEFIKADNKFIRTMIPLLFRPGYLTRHYVEGKRQRYLSPFRLYLVVSALFFYALAQNSFTQKLERGFMQGEQMAKAEKAKADATTTLPGVTFHTHPNTKKPPKVMNWSVNGMDDVPPLPLFGRTIDWKHAPATLADYEQAQTKLDAARRDDWMTRYLMQRIITAKNFTVQSYLDHVFDTLPKVMFVMMPVFALLLKILYFRSPRRYVEHFVLSLHVHTVTFVVFGLALVIPFRSVVELPLLILYVVFYGFWAMKTMYGQGIPKTFLKWLLLAWNYGIALQIGGVLALILSFVF